MYHGPRRFGVDSAELSEDDPELLLSEEDSSADDEEELLVSEQVTESSPAISED